MVPRLADGFYLPGENCFWNPPPPSSQNIVIILYEKYWKLWFGYAELHIKFQ